MESSRAEKIIALNNREIPTSQLDRFVIEQMEASKIPGLSLSIIQDSSVFYSNGYGYENTETKEKVTSDTVFEVASISKPVFTYFVVKQIEKGLLDIDTPVYKYFSKRELEKDHRHRRITTRMILSHTSGLPNWRTEKKLKILFEPNAKYYYSGEGYQYLKEVLCHLLKLNDDELHALFLKEVTGVVGAKHLHYLWDSSLGPRKAYGHINYRPTTNEFRYESNTGRLGVAYNLHANADSYARVLVHMMNLDRENNPLIQEVFRPQFEIPNPENEYPRSIMFPIKEINNRIRYQHGGSNADFQSYFHFYLDEGTGIVLLCNCDNFTKSNFAKRLVGFLGEEWYDVL